MNLISLNTWGGRAGHEQLLHFFEKHKDVDVFCLQEIWSAPYDHLEGHPAGGMHIDHSRVMVYGMQKISELLYHHTPYFRPHHLDNYGLMMLVKNDLKIVAEGEIFVHKEKGFIPEGDVGHHARNIQYVTIATPAGDRTIINFHGLWNGLGKGDSDDRLRQSDNIIQFITALNHPYILCGDFNLLPETQSIKRMEVAGMRNLITEYDITSTRSSLYTKAEKFADYAMVSHDIKINDFRVLPDEVSDHLPLYVDFE